MVRSLNPGLNRRYTTTFYHVYVNRVCVSMLTLDKKILKLHVEAITEQGAK